MTDHFFQQNTAYNPSLNYLEHSYQFIPARETSKKPTSSVIIIDTPHSAKIMPPSAEYEPSQVIEILNHSDLYVDDLVTNLDRSDIGILIALCPRAYLDLNRVPDDIDPDWVSGNPPWPLRPTVKSLNGHGLIWTECPHRTKILKQLLTSSEINQRVAQIWQPYYMKLSHEINVLKGLYDKVIHINCHSMPPLLEPCDIVLGNRKGGSGGDFLIDQMCDAWQGLGYKCLKNKPYMGGEIVRRMGAPERGIHSIQLEISRHLLLESGTQTSQLAQKSKNFDGFCHDFKQFLHHFDQ